MLVALAGCSFSLSGPDPQRPARQVPRCDTGKGLVLTDGLIATTAGIAATSLALDNNVVAILPAVIGAVFIGALIHGNNAVDDCRRENEKYVAELDGTKAPVVADPPQDIAPAPVVVVQQPQPLPLPAPEAWASFWKEVR
jgi:hypothetical protein